MGVPIDNLVLDLAQLGDVAENLRGWCESLAAMPMRSQAAVDLRFARVARDDSDQAQRFVRSRLK